MLSREELSQIATRKDLIELFKDRGPKAASALENYEYERELRFLQIELIKLQSWIQAHKLRVAVLFEGRDAAGKGGTIKRFMEHLNPRSSGVVALTKPTDVEKGQWYFRRYIKELPDPGEIVFFDRSWYNRAVVEPVMGFCTESEYDKFMFQVPEFEHLLYEDGVVVIKFWFSISKEEQKARFNKRIQNPLKRWKYSPVDMKGQQLWGKYTHYKEQMFSLTHTSYCPWIIVQANNKKRARLEAMRYVLNRFNYDGKKEAATVLAPDPNVVMRYHRSVIQVDY
ncbi:MAG: polyphosphate kinase 2 [Bacteroidetes bacterium]|nr:polyphosphate kinase 2 [Bacteroidota bacterium]